ncbi:hypothetical protein HPB50_003660 [Hyalomma asiaticum]|uniref:Uncharacterized protein n=1 Tax=Hyalomma asiaticum TaxID=266040 RepID=A0ACB7TBW3_HYAAI|nr:hypothetical protein HPB50_003660 [Hyalomma asiaticum]
MMGVAPGGLRSVVWADCVQAVIMTGSPLVIIAKIVYDSATSTQPPRPLDDLNIKAYFFRVAFLGVFLVSLFYAIIGLTALAIIYWFRDCDPVLSGRITRYDQGTAVAAVGVFVVQVWQTAGRFVSKIAPISMQYTLDRCANVSALNRTALLELVENAGSSALKAGCSDMIAAISIISTRCADVADICSAFIGCGKAASGKKLVRERSDLPPRFPPRFRRLERRFSRFPPHRFAALAAPPSV